MKEYFRNLDVELEKCLAVAKQARKRGLDPELDIEIPLAEDLASRVENLVGPKGIANRIRAVSKEDNNRESVSLKIAKEVASQNVFKNKEEALYQAVKTGLAILTEGVLCAPIEGVIGVKIRKNEDGTDYADIYYAGPIRSAGGTGQALSVLIADVVRRALGIGKYIPTKQEIERYKEEIPMYKQAQHLQYTPTTAEIELIVSSCPVCINGEGTERVEVSGNRDLPRVETNALRGGACLVIAEGLCLKAPKVQKHTKKLAIDGWDFIDKFVNKAKEVKKEPKEEKEKMIGMQGAVRDRDEEKEGDEGEDEEEDEEEKDENDDEEEHSHAHDAKKEMDKAEIVEPKQEVKPDAAPMPPAIAPIPPNLKYIKELIAGRPVFSHPSRKGGFRLRYGRGRTCGLASIAIHPATMFLVDDFLAVGTQIKIERPGKAGAITPCDQIDGPYILLNNGDLVHVESSANVKQYKGRVKRIVDLGEILIPFGEFAENNHVLPEAAYCQEWWEQELERALACGEGKVPEDMRHPDEKSAFAISEKYGIPLHPAYNFFWSDLTTEKLIKLRMHIAEKGRLENGALVVEKSAEIKDILIELCVTHTERDNKLIIAERVHTLMRCLGLAQKGGRLSPERTHDGLEGKKPLELIMGLSGVKLRDKSVVRIGARMGRPEKAKERKMKPPPHVLFPLGQAGGMQRLVNEAMNSKKITVEVGHRMCSVCGKKTFLPFCQCGGHTVALTPPEKPSPQDIDLSLMVKSALARIGETSMPDVKGVQGLMSREKVPEALEKGILRAKHDVYAFKDGTIRFDMTDVPVSHFKPSEISLSVEKARALGYTHDVYGKPLETPDQILELKVQDFIPSRSCGEYFLRTAQYIDDLLVKFYGMKPFYNAKSSEDLIGQLAIGLAPHTSAGVVTRIIGYTTASAGYAHHYFHAAKRRNCVHPNTRIPVWDEKRKELILPRIGKLVDGISPEGELVPVPEGYDWYVFGLDLEKGQYVKRKVKHFVRTAPPKKWVRIRTESGREFVMTPDHNFMHFFRRFEHKFADDARRGDHVGLCRKFPVEKVEREGWINIARTLRRLEEPRKRRIEIKGAEKYIMSVAQRFGQARVESHILPGRLEVMGGFEAWAKSPNLLELESLAEAGMINFDDLPGECEVTFLGDRVHLPVWVEFDSDLMRLFSHYLAFGSAKIKPNPTIHFKSSLEKLSETRELFRNLFELEVELKENEVKIESRLVYDLFVKGFRLGARAVSKTIPRVLYTSDEEVLSIFLSAVLEDMGRIVEEPSRIAIYTRSSGLIDGLGLLFARLGIFTKYAQPSNVDMNKLTIEGLDLYEFGKRASPSDAHVKREVERVCKRAPRTRALRSPNVGGEEWYDTLLDEVVEVEEFTDEVPAYCLDIETGSDDVLTKNLVWGNGLVQIRCDGDEDCLMMLLDGFLNFSRAYMPERRGGTMDIPLVLSTRLDPNEIDKEAQNVDCRFRYPLEFFEATLRHADPKEIASIMDTVSSRIGTEKQYEHLGFTHDTTNINEGPKESAYKTLDNMIKKMEAQLDLGAKIRAVDVSDMASRVIETHFLPDMIGNLKSFSKQTFRCMKCGAKFRRIPLKGSCTKCEGGNLSLTVHEKSVKKYLEVTKKICEKYAVSDYTKQRVWVMELSMASLFESDKVKKCKLDDFF